MRRPSVQTLFVQVLVLAREMKLLKLGTIALDGTKVHANANKHKALSWQHALKIEGQLRDEVDRLLKLAESTDQKNIPDGMDLPAEIARREARLEGIAQAKAEIRRRAQERYAAERQAYDAKLAARHAQRNAGKKPRGKDPEPPSAEPRDKDQVNLTDEASRIMPVSGGGFEQSYNAQAGVDTDTMLVVTQHVTQATNDQHEVEPTLKQLEGLSSVLGQAQTLMADTGYCSNANARACRAAGIDPLLAPKRQGHHPAPEERFATDPLEPGPADPLTYMLHRLKTQSGRALYRLRKQTVEPVFGIVKNVMGWRQMSMRGLDAAAGEWSLVTMAWNIKRMHVLQLG